MACRLTAILLLLAAGALTATFAAAQDASDSAARLQKMTPEQKDELRRKKIRFDELPPEEKQRLRDLHTSINGDPNAQELSETLRLYNRWLANLDATERSALLDIKDPQQRIARIKELMQQQEERRFRLYAGNLPEEDRKTIHKWLGDWVVAHWSEIRERLPRDVRQRIDDGQSEEFKRQAMVDAWQRSRREVSPGAAEYRELFKQFSVETQKTIEASAASALAGEPEANRTPDRQMELQDRRVEEIVRAARISRFFPVVSQEELLKYYEAMKSDDPRRKQLAGKEGEELRRELQRFYNWEHGFGRGGPPGRGFGPPPGGWGGKPGERFEPPDRGAKPPPP